MVQFGKEMVHCPSGLELVREASYHQTHPGSDDRRHSSLPEAVRLGTVRPAIVRRRLQALADAVVKHDVELVLCQIQNVHREVVMLKGSK